jgi:DMSO/TMAO reductase YedYZ molybdopterin-dependent catalytic subunit
MPRLLPAAMALLLSLAALRAQGPALRVSGAAGRDGVPRPPLALTLADLQTFEHVSARVRSHDGAEHVYAGVPLAEILKRAGQPAGEDLRGSLLTRYVLVTAHDGYRVLFSLPELDPAFTDRQAILADRVDGKPLSDRDGPLRLVIRGEKREARWIRMVEKIEIASAPEPMR